jgi:hypothetical protein
VSVTARAPKPGSRALFVTLVTLANFCGFAPVVLFLDRPLWLVWLLLIALGLALITMKGLGARKARSASNLERVAVGISGLFQAAIAGLFPLAAYGLGRLVDLAIGTARTYPADPVRWGRILAVGFGSVFLVAGVQVAARNIAAALYPRTGVGNPPLYPKLNWRKLLAIGLPVTAAAGALCFADLQGWWWASLSLQFLLIFASAPLNSEFTPRPAPVLITATTAVERMIAACGYTMVPRVQTGDASLDNLISVFDLLAKRETNVLAIQFKTAEAPDAPPVTWEEASQIPTAAWALRKAAAKLNVTAREITAILVLVGRRGDRSLRGFAEEEQVRVAELEPETAARALEAPDPELRDLAARHLGIAPLQAAAPGAPSSRGQPL